MKWINILGMTLQFISFWFAAPEILGEEKLKHYEEKIKKYLSNIPTFLFGVPSIVFAFIFFMSGNKGNGGMAVFLMVITIIFRNKIQKQFAERAMKPFLDSLIASDDRRQDYLRLAGLLFTAGFFCTVLAAAFS